MKPYFNKQTLAASTEGLRLPPCNCVRVYSVSGTVTIQFDQGDAIPLTTGDVFKCDFGAVFEDVRITTAAGASAIVIYGMGGMSNVAAGVAGGGGVQSASGSPEGVLDATNGQLAYDAAAVALWVNPGTTGNTGWVQLIG